MEHFRTHVKHKIGGRAKAMVVTDGRTVREVAISLFEEWLRQKKQPAPHSTSIDWKNFQAPLSHLIPDEMTDHSTEAMRKSITEIDRLIHAESTSARLPLVTFEKAAARLPHTQLL